MVVASEHGAVVRLFVSHHCWCLRWSWSWSQSVLHDVTPAASWSRLYYRLPKPFVSCRNLASLSVALRCATRLISRDELSGSLAGQRRADLRTGMTSAQPAEARLESAGQGRPWRLRCCRAYWSSELTPQTRGAEGWAAAAVSGGAAFEEPGTTRFGGPAERSNEERRAGLRAEG
jgi:hypothetical protein